jgi:hypothetical protein
MSREGLARLEQRRKDALSRGDARTYTELCGDLGISPEEIEDPHLVERAKADEIIRKAGGFERYIRNSGYQDVEKKRKTSKRPKPANYSNDVVALERIYRTAFAPFPPLDRGERLMVSEIKERLGQLVHAGYSGENDVPKGYRNMQRGGAWNCLKTAQSKIEKIASEKIPHIVEEVKRQNMNLEDEAYNLR